VGCGGRGTWWAWWWWGGEMLMVKVWVGLWRCISCRVLVPDLWEWGSNRDPKRFNSDGGLLDKENCTFVGLAYSRARQICNYC